jgi:RNA polymerase sigma-70 factor (ECF subfamily)
MREPSPVGDSKIAALYREYGTAVYRKCLRLLKEPAAARDATQEVFLKLLHDIDRLQDRETLLPWLYRVAINHCLNVRRNTQGQAADPDSDLDVALPPEVSTDSYPKRALVQTVLSRYDAATQAVAVGVIVDGMDHEEVALALGVSRRAVGRKLARFLATARAFLEPQGELARA